MRKRKSLSNKTRIEVFKRDNFTCQYCGRKVPEVTLNCDHIEPVSKGGTNDLLNLITSCEQCNNGKGATRLNDNTVVTLQINQLNELQKKRQQTEMLLEWKKSLENFEEEKTAIVIRYIEQRIHPYKLSKNQSGKVRQLIGRFSPVELMDSIDIGAKSYLKFDHDGDLRESSVSLFLKKIGGIAYIRAKSPIQQKIAQIKAVGRKRFSYWNNWTGNQILEGYASKLSKTGWTENEIVKELEITVLEMTKKIPTLTNWKKTISQWKKDLIAWNRSKEVITSISILDSEYNGLKKIALANEEKTIALIAIILHLSTIFKDFNTNSFLSELDFEMYAFLEKQDSDTSMKNKNYFANFIRTSKLTYHFKVPHNSSIAKGYIRKQILAFLAQIFEDLYVPKLGLEEKNAEKLLILLKEIYQPLPFKPTRNYTI